MGESCLIVENFNDEPVSVSLGFRRHLEAHQALVLPGSGSVGFSCNGGTLSLAEITPRTLVAVEY
jgi:hypothetical protein